MGVMKNFDIRIRNGGNDAIAAACELAPRWTAVAQQLPEPGETVLAYYRILDADGKPACTGFDGNGGFISQDFCERKGDFDDEYGWAGEENNPQPKGYVRTPYSHWMRLPHPPTI